MDSLFGNDYTLRASLHPTSRDRVERSYDMDQVYDDQHYAVIAHADLVPAPGYLGVIFYGKDHTGLVLNECEEALLVQRVRVVHNISSKFPVSVSVSWFRGAMAKQCPKLMERERIPQGTPSYMKECTGTVIASITESLSASYASETESRFLELQRETPVMRKRSHMYNADDLLIEYSESSILPDRWSIYNYQA